MFASTILAVSVVIASGGSDVVYEQYDESDSFVTTEVIESGDEWHGADTACATCRRHGFGVCKAWWHPLRDMTPHQEYFPPNHGYYYFRPYNSEHIYDQQSWANEWNHDPRHPYTNRFFQGIYEQVEEESQNTDLSSIKKRDSRQVAPKQARKTSIAASRPRKMAARQFKPAPKSKPAPHKLVALTSPPSKKPTAKPSKRKSAIRRPTKTVRLPRHLTHATRPTASRPTTKKAANPLLRKPKVAQLPAVAPLPLALNLDLRANRAKLKYRSSLATPLAKLPAETSKASKRHGNLKKKSTSQLTLSEKKKIAQASHFSDRPTNETTSK